jgi:hypothetical protein
MFHYKCIAADLPQGGTGPTPANQSACITPRRSQSSHPGLDHRVSTLTGLELQFIHRLVGVEAVMMAPPTLI